MTTIHILALAGYFLILAEFIAMRHRDICAESDDVIYRGFLIDARSCWPDDANWEQFLNSHNLYWNRGTK
ncbi:hypothetical protein [Quatrionicoccus australiensis]|uniref:hypothetical protein n=1 Tax=Quatrionicoccus australiensis TaxID=138118 RepID=UPI001CFA56E2|nr:hypothetical protein [Quatrionicoccus australiensis]MCB4358476.1 hypothetical protein [Quatrionicoccus australiensis]